jgi:hypothetical protein
VAGVRYRIESRSGGLVLLSQVSGIETGVGKGFDPGVDISARTGRSSPRSCGNECGVEGVWSKDSDGVDPCRERSPLGVLHPKLGVASVQAPSVAARLPPEG